MSKSDLSIVQRQPYYCFSHFKTSTGTWGGLIYQLCQRSSSNIFKWDKSSCSNCWISFIQTIYCTTRTLHHSQQKLLLKMQGCGGLHLWALDISILEFGTEWIRIDLTKGKKLICICVTRCPPHQKSLFITKLLSYWKHFDASF